MRTIFSLIVLSLIISSVFSYPYWQCGATGKHNCQQNQTCCRSRNSQTGWTCYPLIEGVCCSDGFSVCPKGTKCNLRDRTCPPANTSEAFLTMLLEPKTEGTEPTTSSNDYDLTKIAQGFVEGIEILKGIKVDCLMNDSRIYSHILNIIEIVVKIDLQNLFESVNKIKIELTEISKIIVGRFDKCKEETEEIKLRLELIKKYVSDPSYMNRVAAHFFEHSAKILAEIKDLVKEKDSFTLGNKTGSVLHEVFFYDLNVRGN